MDVLKMQDLSRLHRSIQKELAQAIEGVLDDGQFVGGHDVTDFEVEFAAAHRSAAAAACGSGTDALTIALKATGVAGGDEVIVPSMTFVATAEAVLHASARPVIADVDPETLLLTPHAVESVRSDRTRAVIPVHLYGHVVQPEIMQAWRKDGLVVIEDAAQSHLAERDGEVVGSWGDAACFSFFPGKNLGALGDGGILISNDYDVICRARRLRNHGRSSKYEHQDIGWCSRLDTLQAAVLRVKLGYLPHWTTARRAHAAHYAQRLASLSPTLSVVPWEPGAVHHLFVVRVGADIREAIRAGLHALGIETGLHYPMPLSLQPALRPWSQATPEAEKACEEIFSLPMDPLMSQGDVHYVCDAIEQVLEAVL